MDVVAAMKALEAAGSEATRRASVRHGVAGAQFGVSHAVLARLVKQAGSDTALARELWKTGNHDARVLATMVADGATLPIAELDQWGREVANKAASDAVGRLAGLVPGAKETILSWTKSPDEWIGRAGWMGVAAMASAPVPPPETELEGFISSLEKGIHRTKNHVKDARLCLLIAIGSLSDALEARALAVARRIGPIDVDHGDTACETPDPLSYIPKARGHRRAQERKAARAKRPAASAATHAETAVAEIAPKAAAARRPKTGTAREASIVASLPARPAAQAPVTKPSRASKGARAR